MIRSGMARTVVVVAVAVAMAALLAVIVACSQQSARGPARSSAPASQSGAPIADLSAAPSGPAFSRAGGGLTLAETDEIWFIQRGDAPLLGDIPLIGETVVRYSGGATDGNEDHTHGFSNRRTKIGATPGEYRIDPYAASPLDGPIDPQSGCIVTVLPGEQKLVPVPLAHTRARADIAGAISAVRITQRFHNPYSSKIEAVYVFPLPQDGAVTEFVMRIGERQIRGIIREREEAERLYAEAKSQGYVASLMTQERPNIFTQKVANIEPGKQIDVDITYFHTAGYRDGAYEFVFPMVVGPRFNPQGSTDGVGAVPRTAYGASGQKTEVQYLSPGERSGHDIDLEVAIEAGATLGDIRCRTHTVEIEREGASRAVVRLTANDRIPNKDFVLRYEVEGAGVTPSAIASAGEDGGHIALTITPPPSLAGLPRQPLEFVFVLDCSGSMHGIPLTQAKAAAARAMRRLQPQDSFQIIRFSDSSSALGSRPLEATPDNIRRGLRYLESLNSGGGTMMIEGIKAALDFPHDPERLRFVVFLTDGYIGNETEILRAMSERLGAARVFSFGVGSSTNRYLMERMAQLGRGVSAYITPNDSAVEPMDAFFDRVAFAAMTDISIDWGGLQVADVQPGGASIPDLFVGRPVVVTARLLAPAEGGEQIRITGRAAGKPQSLEAPVVAQGASAEGGAIGHIWARMMLASLMDRAALIEGAEAADLAGDVKRLALAHGLLSAYTAFIAVDSSRRTEGDFGTTVAVPVPVPEGVRYETTVAPAEEGRGG